MLNTISSVDADCPLAGKVLPGDELLYVNRHEIRDVLDIGVTIDERIADGFYFVRSLKLVKHIFSHPELLDQPLGVPSGFEYK